MSKNINSFIGATALVAAGCLTQATAADNDVVHGDTLDNTPGSATQCLITRPPKMSLGNSALGFTVEAESIKDCFDFANNLLTTGMLPKFNIAALRGTEIAAHFVCERERGREGGVWGGTTTYTNKCTRPAPE